MVKKGNIIYLHRYHSPCGGLLIGECEGRLCLCDWDVPERREGVINRVINGLDAKCANYCTPLIDCAITQLDKYFKGARKGFDLPIIFVGTDFQRRVWQKLQQIPYGETASYSQLAIMIGNPQAVRGVGSASRAIIGRGGSLTGYAGGIAAKHYLLSLESRCQSEITSLT